MAATASLARYLVSAKVGDLPDWTLHEAKRTLINLLGVSLSASVMPAGRIMLDWAAAEAAAPRASVIGSGLRTSPATAALLNGYLAHLQDYDDTHFPTVLHPSAPVWPAVLAAAEDTGASGSDACAAFVLGAEAACRVAMSVHPWHYDAGWHITGTAGGFGAAAGAGRLLGLSAEQMTHALGVAGTQAGGVREVFGSDSKAMHPAKGAANGLQAAQLAKAGFTSADDILGGRRGFWAVLSAGGHSEEQLLGGLGERWELANNGLKPYANGVVSHPIQDAVIQLRNEHGLRPEQVTAISARVNPLVLELMDRPQPRRGLEGKFSFQHCAAAALVDGAGHDAQFSDERVADPAIAALRALVSATPDDAMGEDQVHVAISLVDGRTVETRIEHATGSPGNPMTDEALEAKYRAIATPVIGEEQAEKLLAAAWALDGAPDVGAVASLMVVEDA
ncbi:MAG: MmgE/PrpD family protein [Chloroflexi bacterium]|nr:MmgE/PrpD family protein [Chloroflexota bacterium]